MGRYVTPAGVEIEMSDRAASVIGFKPAEEPRKAPRKQRSKGEDDK